MTQSPTEPWEPSYRSWLLRAAANAAVRAGRRAAILDTDLGQSEVGPPGTIGVVRLEAPVSTVSDLQPRALAFVGATSPYGHLLAVVQGTRRLVSHALTRNDDVVFVDALPSADETRLRSASRGLAALGEPSALRPLADAFVRVAPTPRSQRQLVCDAYHVAGSDRGAFAPYASAVRGVATLTDAVRALLDGPEACDAPPSP